MALQTDPPRAQSTDEIIARIDELVSPVSLDEAEREEARRLELFRSRFANALGDLELSPACGIFVETERTTIIIRTKDRRAAEILLRVIEHHADHHRWGSTRW